MALASWSQEQILDQLDTGYHWSSSTITYAFPAASSGIYGSQEGAGFVALNATQQYYAKLALQTWDELIAANLAQTTAAGSNIEFGTSTTGVSYAHAYLPTTGSVWFNRAYSDLMSPEVGEHGFLSYVHEIGHALGLDHMGNYNGSGDWTPSCYQDSGVYSLMSYFGPNWGSGAANGEGLVAWADWIGADGYRHSPQTPMLNDILAIQSIYGAETTTRSGDTTYGFSSNIAGTTREIYDFTVNLYPILTIYDAAGTDTLNLSGWTTESIINLTPGSFSSCNSMTSNIAIAYNCDIENAIGGGGNDILTGNLLANLLDGGAGNDTLFGGGGNDTFLASLGNDTFDGGDGYDTLVFNQAWASYSFSIGGDGTLVFSSSTTGTDTLRGLELLQFSDTSRTVAELTGQTENPASISIVASSASIQEGNSGTQTVTFVVSLSAALSTSTSVSWSVSGNTDALDFAGSTSDTLNFLAGETEKIIQLQLNGDTLIEADELFTVTLSNPSGNAQISNASASMTVLNDDSVPVIVDDYPLTTATPGVVTVNGSAVSGSIETADDGDLFRVSLVAGTTYEFTLNRTGGDLNAYLELYSANLQWLAGNDDASAGTLDSRIVFTATTTGTYYLAAWDYTAQGTGSYLLNAIGYLSGNTLYGTASANTLNGGSGNDFLYGLAGNDTLNGNAGDDYLDGGTGNDRLAGGLGNDTYIVDSTKDTVSESSASGGTDLVVASISCTLGKYIENLALSGSSALNGTGNTLANTLTGNAGNNKLQGLAGNDTLLAGAGQDILLGGLGNDILTGDDGMDVFRFDSTLNSTSNVDTVTDFMPGSDRLQLENTVFRKLTATGTLAAANFASNPNGLASDGNDYIVYNTSTGALYYDMDGNGTGNAVLFAKLTGIPELSASDIFIT